MTDEFIDRKSTGLLNRIRNGMEKYSTCSSKRFMPAVKADFRRFFIREKLRATTEIETNISSSCQQTFIFSCLLRDDIETMALVAESTKKGMSAEISMRATLARLGLVRERNFLQLSGSTFKTRKMRPILTVSMPTKMKASMLLTRITELKPIVPNQAL